MDYRLSFFCVLIVISTICLPASLEAQDASEPRTKRVQEFSARLIEQDTRSNRSETLRQSREFPDFLPSLSQEFSVRLGKGVEVVTECSSAKDVYAQRDYFMHESKVYAHRILQIEPCVDGKTKRISESCVFFQNGSPFYRSSSSTRVPVKTPVSDFIKVKIQTLGNEVALQPGLDGWGDKLTSHAFGIARTFREGIGRYTLEDWDTWLLKGAPPEDASVPAMKGRDWLPPAGTLVLPVRESESPDRLFAVGWGYEKGPVDWTRLAHVEAASPGLLGSNVTFSTVMVDGPLGDGLDDDSNFLLNQGTGKPLCRIGIHYHGERRRFNHDGLIAHWSPNASCVVAIVTAKWFTEYGQIAWIKDGKCEGSHDVIEPLKNAGRSAIEKSKHPAAKRVSAGEDYSYTLSNILLEDDGRFEAVVVGEIPKDDTPGGFFEVIIEGVFTPAGKDEPAILRTHKTRVLPYSTNR